MMSFNAAANLLNLDRLYLEIPEHSYHEPTVAYSTAGGYRRALINQMVLDAFLPWVKAEQNRNAHLWKQGAAWPSIWEFVNGAAIEVDGLRLVLIPSEAIDTDELRVAQEWVDIPDWAADYYIAVQVNLDEGWLQIWGYTTHQQLKTIAEYDAGDRAYALAEEALIQDLNVLWVAQEFGVEASPRSAIAALPALSLDQAHNLIARLGDPDLTFPRQALPFQLWGALLAHGGWRKQLYERRQGMVEQWSVAQWFRAGVSGIAEQFGWGQPQLQFATVRGTRSTSQAMTRSLEIAAALYTLQISQISESTTPDASAWRFELRPASEGGSIPAGFKLRLLAEDLQPFENNEDSAIEPSDRLYVDVLVLPGEGLVWEIEPAPVGYEQEVLRF